MKKAFQLKVTSAMFMHGTEQKKEAELRPPSFKGEMRYWFRALAANSYKLEQLAELENKIFGSADQDNGSKLILRVSNSKIETSEYYLLPHKEDQFRRGEKEAVEPGSSFTLELIARPGLDPKYFTVACWSLWVAINLGGFGQRARRGAGSLLLLDNPNLDTAEKPFNFVSQFNTTQELKNYLEQGLSVARHWIGQLEQPAAPPPTFIATNYPDYPVLNPIVAKVQIAQINKQNEQDARKELMLRLRGYKNPAFGLPYNVPQVGGAWIRERHASPMHLHLTPLSNRQFALVQTLMYQKLAAIPLRQPNALPNSGLDWSEMKRYLNESNATLVNL